MLQKFEKTLVGWMKDLPHLPDGFTKWLAVNSWWLVLIGVVLGVFGVITTVNGLILGSAILSYYGVRVGVGGAYVLSTWIAVAGMIAVIVVEAMAISPLKSGVHKSGKRGWDLLFLAATIGFAVSALSDLIVFNLGALIGLVIGAAIGYYILIEIRVQFVKSAAKPVDNAPKTPEENA